MAVESIVDRHTSALTIRPEGRFDFTAQLEFRGAYEKEIAKATSIQIDLKEVTYMDSSALGMLLVLRKGAQSRNISITGASETIMRILSIANFDKLFDIS